MTDRTIIDPVTIVLNNPKYPENIGAAARAMRNMGFSRLVVVTQENPDRQRILKMATHEAAEVVERMERFDNLTEALSPFGYVVGTTARTGRQRTEAFPPDRMAERIIPLAEKNRVAVLFGPEDRGLTNAEIALCHAYVNIPTADFSSLNLAQAVMVICYELSRAATKVPETKVPAPSPRLATGIELSLMYGELSETFARIGFENPENRGYWVDRFRKLFSRLHFGAKEVRMIRGMCRKIGLFGEERYREGQKSCGKGAP